MSSSCLNRFAFASLLLLTGFALAPLSARAQTYFVPKVDLSAEYHTDRELSRFSGSDATTGYIASLQAIMGKRTQRSDTEFRPRLRFQEYPDRSGVDPVDAFLDLSTNFRTEKSIYSLLASGSRQDTFNAEFGDASIDPDGPQTPPEHNDTGIVFVGNTRTEIELQPSMERALTERTRLNLTVDYDKVHYENTTRRARESYSLIYLTTTFKHELRPNTDIEIGPYISRYDSDETDGNRTDGAGVTVAWNHQVSEVSGTKFGISGERNKIDDPLLTGGEKKQTNWGAELSGYRRGQVSRFDYGVGRYLAASGIGSKTRRDELRFQLSRSLTPRLSFLGAVRGGSEQRLGFADASRDRSYARAELSMRYALTQTIYVGGGYRYAWQKYKDTDLNADDNVGFVSLTYQGLDIRRAAVRGTR